ncbi:hypothetical protein HPB47_021328 [Ixodes persulcatus]|uniref:Uncharacterized protein n=1 Tax=Ixodes persulcatus TaxID=34615 RepID=A0AC60QEP2_IXOPE|nr:hypothetical protein HPB47_021328 [Ixodes persulcatus]
MFEESDSVVEKLIEEIRFQPCVCDTRKLEYRYTNRKGNAWDAIRELCGLPTVFCHKEFPPGTTAGEELDVAPLMDGPMHRDNPPGQSVAATDSPFNEGGHPGFRWSGSQGTNP